MKPRKNLAKRCELFACAFLLILSMTACGSGKETKQSKDKEGVQTEEAITPEEETEETESGELNENGKFGSIQEMLDSDLMSEQLKSQMASLKDSGITNMLGSGVPVSFVKQQADHSSLAMTSIYLGKSPNASEELKKTHIIK